MKLDSVRDQWGQEHAGQSQHLGLDGHRSYVGILIGVLQFVPDSNLDFEITTQGGAHSPVFEK